MTKKQDGFSKDFVKEAAKKGGFKTLGDVVGLPDQKDWQNIVEIIKRYRKESIAYYGKDILVEAIADAKKAHAVAGNRYDSYAAEFQVVNKDSGMRHIFELPESFVRTIEKAYPLMFSSKEHFAWFSKNFKELRLSDKY